MTNEPADRKMIVSPETLHERDSKMFKWIRTRVRDAFLAGIQDGVDALNLPVAGTADGQLDLPEPRLLRLPPGEEDITDIVTPPAKRKKAQS